MQKDLSQKEIRKDVRKILNDKAYIRTLERENITRKDVISESLELLTKKERDILELRYDKKCSWLYIQMQTHYSESEVMRTDGKAVDKIGRVIRDIYDPKMYAFIRSAEKFMLHSDEIKRGILNTEELWKTLNTEERKERILDDYERRIKDKDTRKVTRKHYKKCVWLIGELQGDELEYFLEISHRLIMLHAEIMYEEQLEKEGDETNIYYDKEYEECTVEEKADRLYNLMGMVFVEEKQWDYTDIRKKGIEYYKDSPIDVLINLKTLEDKALEKYIEEIEPMFEEENIKSIMVDENDIDNIKAREQGLNGDYAGTGFGKPYAECTISEKRQRQYNFFTDMASYMGKEKINDLCENVFLMPYNQLIAKLNMLKGKTLEEFINKLPPIGF